MSRRISGRGRTFPNGQERHAAGRSGVAKLELVGSQRRNCSFLVGHSRHVRKSAGLKFDRHYLASLVDRVRTVVGDGRCDNRLSFFRGCLRAIIGCDFWYLRARLEEGEMAVT